MMTVTRMMMAVTRMMITVTRMMMTITRMMITVTRMMIAVTPMLIRHRGWSLTLVIKAITRHIMHPLSLRKIFFKFSTRSLCINLKPSPDIKTFQVLFQVYQSSHYYNFWGHFVPFSRFPAGLLITCLLSIQLPQFTWNSWSGSVWAGLCEQED